MNDKVCHVGTTQNNKQKDEESVHFELSEAEIHYQSSLTSAHKGQRQRENGRLEPLALQSRMFFGVG